MIRHHHFLSLSLNWIKNYYFLGRVRILIKIRLKIKFDIFSIVNLSKFSFFFLNKNTKHRLLKSGRDNTTLSRTNTQAKNYLFSQSPSIDNSAENILSIMSICETNSSSKSTIDIWWDRTGNQLIANPIVLIEF